MASERAAGTAGAGSLAVVDELIDSILANPRDEKLKVLQLGGKMACVNRVSGGCGVDFLLALGYTEKKGFLVHSGRHDPAILYLAKEAIGKAREGYNYQVAEALDASNASAHRDAEEARAAMALKKTVKEPGAGETRTRLTFQVSRAGGKAGREAQYERSFRPDDTLADVVHFLGTRDSDQVSAPCLRHPLPMALPFRDFSSSLLPFPAPSWLNGPAPAYHDLSSLP